MQDFLLPKSKEVLQKSNEGILNNAEVNLKKFLMANVGTMRTTK